MNQNIDFDELFALRFQFLDTFEDENDIIRELKYVLVNRGVLLENIPGLLKEFYENYGITMTIEKIKEALVNPQENLQNQLTQLFNNYFQQQTQYQGGSIEVGEEDIEDGKEDIEDGEDDEYDIEVEDDDDDDDGENQDSKEDNENQDSKEDEENTIVAEQQSNQQPVNNSSGNVIEGQQPNQQLLQQPNQQLLQQLFISMSSSLNGPSYSVSSSNNLVSPMLLQPDPLQNLLNNLFHTLPLDMPGLQPMLPPLINFGYDMYPMPTMPAMEDVRTTLDDEDSDNIKKVTLENKLEQNCIICMSSMDKEQEVAELPCEHFFHSDCIGPWLKEYNYKCPICRKEVGKAKYNL